MFQANICVLQLNNRLFEELAMDVYDEVDRRENETSKIASVHDASHQLIGNIAMISIYKVKMIAFSFALWATFVRL